MILQAKILEAVTKIPLSNASAVVLDSEFNPTSYGAMADENGYITLDSNFIPPGSWIEISHVDHNAIQIRPEDFSEEVYLSENGNMEQAVIVTVNLLARTIKRVLISSILTLILIYIAKKLFKI